jgi:hypothetical protein
MKRLSGTFRRRPDTTRTASVLGTHNPVQEPSAAARSFDAVSVKKPSKLPEPASRARARASAASSRQQKHLLTLQQHQELPQREKNEVAAKSAPRADRSKSMSHAAAHVIVRGTATFRATSMVEPSPDPDRQPSMTPKAPVDRQVGKCDIPFFTDASTSAGTSSHPEHLPNDLRPASGSDQAAEEDVSALRPPKNPSVLVRRVSGVKTGLRAADPNATDAAVVEHRTLTTPDMLSTAKPAKYPRQQTFAPGHPARSQSPRGYPRPEQVTTGTPRTVSPVQRSRSPSPPSPSIADGPAATSTRSATERRRPSSFSAISQRRDKAEARSLGSACGSLEREIASIEQQARNSASNIDTAAFLETRASALRQVLASLEDRYDSIEAYYVKGREYAQAMGRFYQVSPEEYERWSRGSRSSSLSSSRRPSSKSNGHFKGSAPANNVQTEDADQFPVRTYMR